jgi:hypothetical protein
VVQAIPRFRVPIVVIFNFLARPSYCNIHDEFRGPCASTTISAKIWFVWGESGS